MTDRRINIRFPQDLFKKLDQKRSDEETKFQHIGERLFGEWLHGNRSTGTDTLQGSDPSMGPVPTPPQNAGVVQIDDILLRRVIQNQRHRKWFEMLARILSSENRKAVEAVTRNLDTFDDYVKIKGADIASGKKGSR